jgi:glycine C-acetyltransferase
MSRALLDHAAAELAAIREAGLWKRERAIASPQGGSVVVAEDVPPGAGGHNSGGVELLNLCANNYLGLANHPRLIAAAKAALDSHGFGMASVRFICGTQDLHLALEQKLAAFLHMDDAILFSSCFDANGGVFEALLGAEDAIISDALNHASIIDGVRLCKARRLRYSNNDMGELEARLIEAKDARSRLIVTDGVFSMDGIIANLAAICDLAERHDALVMVDDSHAVGFIGARGAGTPERCGVEGRVHLISGTLGKALGGASGGYIAGPKPFVDLLRQRARPYLFSNALAPSITAATIEALELVATSADLRENLTRNAAHFRKGLTAAGFTLTPGEHPIIPVMIGDAAAAARLAGELQRRGVYVTAFSYPVVPHGKARIRTQMNAAHSLADLDRAIAAFASAGHAVGLIP